MRYFEILNETVVGYHGSRADGLVITFALLISHLFIFVRANRLHILYTADPCV